ncbi:MAG: hypothetical protein ACE5JL_07610 [Dehalococcoidia bacterium]
MADEAASRFAAFDDYRPTVTIAVAFRWVGLAAYFAMTNERSEMDATHIYLNLLGGGLAALNAYVTWLILRHRPIT